MIDIVFQLIAFFMVISNFEQTQADERVRLPTDLLAQPPSVKPAHELVLNVGFSHQVTLQPLDGASFEVETPTRVHISGIDKQVVGQQAALVRRVRPPEPYKGKGIRYENEVVRRKAGKARIGAGG
jgi:biopolymer transport protein ExbD